MRQVLTIAGLTIRGAIRSRVFASLLTLTLIAVIVLPAIIKGDGTIEGQAGIVLHYTLSAVVFLLAAASVWIGCTSASVEIEGKHIHMLVTKPVRRGTIWLGKWIGVIAMIAVLLAVSTTATYIQLHRSLRSLSSADPESPTASEVLSARDIISPYEHAVNTMHIMPEQSQKWRFDITDKIQASSDVMLHFVVESPNQLDLTPLHVTWHIGSDAARRTHEMDVLSSAAQTIRLSADQLEGSDILEIEYVNTEADRPVTVRMHPDTSVSLRVERGSFEANLFRAVLIVFLQLALISALGVTMGCLFSSPVAVFASYAVITVFMFGDFIAAAATDTDMALYRPVSSITSLDPVLKAQFKAFNALVTPASQFRVIKSLPRGELVSWRFVGRAVFILLFLYTGVTGIAGSWLFNRRELGIPPD